MGKVGAVSSQPLYEFASTVATLCGAVVPPAACGVPNADPTMFVTMTWTDLDVTKDFLGCTWTNGETKEVYSTFYTKSRFGSPYSPGAPQEEEVWANSTAPNGERVRMEAFGSPFVGFSGGVRHDEVALGIGTAKEWGTQNFLPVSSNVASFSPVGTGVLPYTNNAFGGHPSFYIAYPFTSGWAFHGDPGYIKTQQRSAFVTFTNGITISWSQGNGW